MKKSFIILLHIAFWGCYFILIMVMLGFYFHADEAPEERIEEAFHIAFFFALLPSLVGFYAFYFFIFPRYFQKNKYLQTALYGMVFSFLGAFLGMLSLSTVITDDCEDDQDVLGTFLGVLTFMAFEAFVTGLIALLVRGFITWFEEVKLREALKSKNQSMELALLKAQLDPHFLFNTINNIDVLILKNPEIASEYLNKLSNIMRFMLFETKSADIPLSKELEYIEKYIELQKIRTANTEYVQYAVQGNANGHRIAPMLFIPFIENAFKHTTNKKLKDAISIQINIEKAHIQLKCVNKYDASRSEMVEKHGLGNALIKKRLDLLYPDAYSLRMENKGEQYEVDLII